MVDEVRDKIVTDDGIGLSTASWVPEHPKAAALLVHGHAEHLGRYGHVVAALNAHGYAVHGHDLRGHGRSGGVRALAMRFDDYQDDLRLVALRARQTHPDLPTVLIGHSMGGLIAARYALAFGADLNALVTSGAAFVIDEGVSAPQRTVLRLVSRIAPKAPVPRGDEENVLSSDPAVEAAFAADPLNYHGKTRVRTAVEMMNAGADALRQVPRLRVSYLAMHGADDRLTSPRGTERFHADASSPDKTLRLWPHMRHEIFNEIEGQTVIDAMVAWLDERVPSRQP